MERTRAVISAIQHSARTVSFEAAVNSYLPLLTEAMNVRTNHRRKAQTFAELGMSNSVTQKDILTEDEMCHF